MKATLSSTDLATLLRINPRSVPRWARAHGVTPLRRQRIGSTTVTVWDIAALGAAARPRLTGGRHAGSNTSVSEQSAPRGPGDPGAFA